MIATLCSAAPWCVAGAPPRGFGEAPRPPRSAQHVFPPRRGFGVWPRANLAAGDKWDRKPFLCAWYNLKAVALHSAPLWSSTTKRGWANFGQVENQRTRDLTIRILAIGEVSDGPHAVLAGSGVAWRVGSNAPDDPRACEHLAFRQSRTAGGSCSHFPFPGLL